jgi:proton-translocating NADH-quinone oxidoreductase chain L
MLLLIIWYPLVSFFFALFFFQFLGKKGVIFLSNILIFFSLIFSIILLIQYYIFYGDFFYLITVGSWIDYIFSFTISWNFFCDELTLWMVFIVTFISFSIHLYSIDYMMSDPNLTRFLSFLSIFTFFMLLLVTSGNFFQLFIGWEGVGLASYLLINFWHTRPIAGKSAFKALIMNRIGDFGYLIALILILYLFNTVNFFELSCFFFFNSFFVQTMSVQFFIFYIGIFLFLGVIGKSAQLFLHTWLPDAMEGPTPVSALLHSATMVTAGIFLLIRSSFFFSSNVYFLFFISVFGVFTSFFASFSGFLQNDIKKIIAYSTCSHLGYMLFTCGLSFYSLSFFHLLNHAFFKALLFLSAGSIIHALDDEQDIRRMGFLVNLLPFTYIVMFFALLSSIGFPFLSGYYSKDFILEISFLSFFFGKTISFIIAFTGLILSIWYSFRLFFFIFLNKGFFFRTIYQKTQESSLFMGISLFFLFLGSLFSGFLFTFIFSDIGFFYNKSEIFYFISFFHDNHFLSRNILNLAFYFSFFLIYALFFYSNRSFNFLGFSLFFFILKLISIKKNFYDFLYNKIFLEFYFVFLCYFFSYKILDKGFLEIFSNVGISYLLLLFSKKFVLQFQNGYLNTYLFYIFCLSFFIFFIFEIFICF